MSDQQRTGTGVILGLEELFLAREFGRRPMHRVPSALRLVESEPVQLEEVLLSDVFGRPEVVTAATRVIEEAAPRVGGRPLLVLLKGDGAGGVERDAARHRAIAAVSGVAAAALAVAGLASGTGQGRGQPSVTQQAQGVSPNPGPAAPAGGSQPAPGAAATQPGPSGTGAPAPSPASGGGTTFAQFSSVSSPPSAATIPSGTAGEGAAPPVAPTTPSGGSPGSPPGSGGGGGSTLTPAVTVVGDAVSSVGSTVTTTSDDLSKALPVSAVTGALGTVATSAMNNVGGGSPPDVVGAL